MVRSCRLKVTRLVPDALAQSVTDRQLAICAHTASGSSSELAHCLAIDPLCRLGGILWRHSDGSDTIMFFSLYIDAHVG